MVFKVKGDDSLVPDYLNEHWIKRAIKYMIDSKYRKLVSLSNWLEEQVKEREILDDLVKLENWREIEDINKRVIKITRWVKNEIQYKKDSVVWGRSEYWATGIETLEKGFGDCDSQSILLFVLLRKAGVPANRLRLCAGWANAYNKRIGHAWVRYLPENYADVVYLDTTFYYDSRYIPNRAFFDDRIEDNLICVNHRNCTPESLWSICKKYKSLWFSVNDKVAYGSYQSYKR